MENYEAPQVALTFLGASPPNVAHSTLRAIISLREVNPRVSQTTTFLVQTRSGVIFMLR